MNNIIRKPHAVIFPIPLQGHINPMMLLAKHLNSSGIRVTFLLPKRTLSILHTINNKHKSDGCTGQRALAEGPRHPCCVHDRCGTTCNAEGGMLNNNKYANNNHITKVDDGIHNYGNTCCKHKNGDDNDDDHTETEHATNATNIIDASSNYSIDDEDDNIGCACNDDSVPPIQFEMLPDLSSSEDRSLPMSSYVLVFLDSKPLLMKKLEEILEKMQQREQPATCIISDSFVPWTQDVADTFGIPRMEFWSSSVMVYSMGYHIPQLIDRGYLPVHPGDAQESCIDIIPGLAPFRLADFFYDLQPHAISSPVFDLICKAFSRAKEAQRVLVNSFYHLEKDIIEALQVEGISIYPIGPLTVPEPSVMCVNHAKQQPRSTEEMKVMSTSLYADDEDCLAWLDTQEESSVIYVSFGSMVSISKEEMEELLLGLEASQQPYLLVMRPDMESSVCVQHTCRGRARICEWVPQIHVLRHPAVGAFLTHCGWNSIMEGIYMGVPMIGCPRESEQHTNMKCLRDEWKVAIGLDQKMSVSQSKQTQGATNKVQIKKELVEEAIKVLMQEEEGVSVRERMKNLQSAAKRAAQVGSSLRMLIHDVKHTCAASVCLGAEVSRP